MKRHASHRQPVVMAMLAVTLAGCATFSSMQKDNPVSTPRALSNSKATAEAVLNVQARKKHALDLQAESRLHEAQLQWRVLLAVDPNNTEYRNRLRVLQALINRRAKNIILLGHNALERNNHKDAERHYLAALTIDPFNAEALESLRALQTKSLTRLQEIKSAKLQKLHAADASEHTDDAEIYTPAKFYYELGVQLFDQEDWLGAAREIGKYLAVDPHHQDAREYYSLAEFLIAQSQINDNQPEGGLKHLKEAIKYSSNAPPEWYDIVGQIKLDLAEQYYIYGVQSVRDNIDIAIEMWQKALINNPRHEKAQIRLDDAMQLRKNESRVVDAEGE